MMAIYITVDVDVMEQLRKKGICAIYQDDDRTMTPRARVLAKKENHLDPRDNDRTIRNWDLKKRQHSWLIRWEEGEREKRCNSWKLIISNITWRSTASVPSCSWSWIGGSCLVASSRVNALSPPHYYFVIELTSIVGVAVSENSHARKCQKEEKRAHLRLVHQVIIRLHLIRESQQIRDKRVLRILSFSCFRLMLDPDP